MSQWKYRLQAVTQLTRIHAVRTYTHNTTRVAQTQKSRRHNKQDITARAGLPFESEFMK